MSDEQCFDIIYTCMCHEIYDEFSIKFWKQNREISGQGGKLGGMKICSCFTNQARMDVYLGGYMYTHGGPKYPSTRVRTS